MQFDRSTTALVFLAVAAAGTLGMLATPMQTSTILAMVVPSMVAYGLAMLALGVKHGQHRAR